MTRKSIPVTDDALDAPDGAVVGGFKRTGDAWQPINSDAFHAHLDKCAQCREHPFGLCAEGEELIHAAVGAKR